jgi:hypothetical protein
MREECKHFQSRTYDDGETARFCVLDLAPEAPWRCPEHCPAYAKRLADVGWVHGDLVSPAVEDEPDAAEEGGAYGVLEDAEEVVSAAFDDTVESVEAEERKRARRSVWRRRRPS